MHPITKLLTATALNLVVHMCRENLLLAERASAQKKLQQLEEACDDSTREAKVRRRDSEQLQAALEAKDAKLSAMTSEKLTLESKLQVGWISEKFRSAALSIP